MITRIVVSDSNFGIGTFFKTLTYKINYEKRKQKRTTKSAANCQISTDTMNKLDNGETSKLIGCIK